MQAAKDSFFRALRSRLAVVNPNRTISANGLTRPAIVVAENQAFPPPRLFFNTFYIHWLAAPVVRGFPRTQTPRYEQIAQIEYFVTGNSGREQPFADRGRLLAELDQELLAILFPGFTEKRDYSRTPPLALGSFLHWRWTPNFRTVIEQEGSVLRRIATVHVSFYLEPVAQ